MNVSDFVTGSTLQLKKILRNLREVHSTDIDFSAASTQELVQVLEHFVELKNKMVMESAYNSFMNNPEYRKVFLIEQAVRIFLREIAPKRLRKRKKTNQETA